MWWKVGILPTLIKKIVSFIFRNCSWKGLILFRWYDGVKAYLWLFIAMHVYIIESYFIPCLLCVFPYSKCKFPKPINFFLSFVLMQSQMLWKRLRSMGFFCCKFLRPTCNIFMMTKTCLIVVEIQKKNNLYMPCWGGKCKHV